MQAAQPMTACVIRHAMRIRSEEHTSELQSRGQLVCRLLLEKTKNDAWFEARSLIETVDDVELIDPYLSGERLLYRRFHERGVRVFNPMFFFFNDTATTEIYTLSLHDALPI